MNSMAHHEPKEGLWSGHVRILQILMEGPKTWTELKKKTGFSAVTISEYLKRLAELGYVWRDDDTRAYRTAWTPKILFPHEMNRFFMASQELETIRSLVRKGSKGVKITDLIMKAVTAHTWMLSAAMPAILYSSLGGKGSYEIQKPESLTKDDWDQLTERIWRDMHRLARDQIDVVLRPWIHRLLNVAFILSSDSKDIMWNVGQQLMERANKELNALEELLRQSQSMKGALNLDLGRRKRKRR